MFSFNDWKWARQRKTFVKTNSALTLGLRTFGLPDTGAAASWWASPRCRCVRGAGRGTSTPRCPWWSRRLRRSSSGPEQRGGGARWRPPARRRGGENKKSYLADEALEEVGLVAEGVVDQPVAEGHDAVGEVVLREPGHHALLLHVGATRHVDDHVAQVLPVPAGTRGATTTQRETTRQA